MRRASYRETRHHVRMNHLAHIYLAGGDRDVQLGGLLGDFWRGAPDPAWREGVRAGVILHRKIDVYTDSHPQVVQLRALFEPPLRRYAGILLDVYFDHVLAQRWAAYSDQPLDAVSEQALDLLAVNAQWLPPNLNRFALYMHNHGLFASYAQRTMIEQVLAGISRRLTRANPLAEAGPELWSRADALDQGFAQFFPELIAFAEHQQGLLGLA
jgi:acyl carrier protein phosphodiesterase